MSERRLLLAVLQMAKTQLALSDAAWRDLIERETGQASCDAAGDAALLKLMRRLKLMGFGSHGAAAPALRQRDCMSLENSRASFETPASRAPQDEAFFSMPSTISPHPELVEGRRMPMQRTHANTPRSEGKGRDGGTTPGRKPQARLVWALWTELGRLGALRDNSRAACRAFCAATAKIPATTDPDFMTALQLDPVIVVLKAWLARTKERRGAAGPMRS